MRLVLLGGLIGSILLACPGMAQSTAGLDEQILRAAKLPTDDAGLLEFLRLRSLRAGDGQVLQKLVEQLGGSSFKEREQADKQLLLRGPIALPYLRKALGGGTVEVVRRAENLVKAIEAMGPEIPVAAARLLAERQTPGALDVLLTYVGHADDDWAEEEVFACLARLAIQHGKIDARLVTALQDMDAARRGAAVYLVGRRGDIGYRQTVRSFLADPDAGVREQAFLSLAGKRLPQMIRDSAASDDEQIKKYLGDPDTEGLLTFLRRRTLSEDDQNRLRGFIRLLGDAKFRVRDDASRLLIKEGTPALAFLKPAAFAADVEVARRARLCAEEIRKGPGPALPIAVVHRLARSAPTPPGAVAVLLNYLPFADDENVEEEILHALTVFSARTIAIDPLLPASLSDPMPARRAAAALVLGRVGGADQLAGVFKLLDDPAALVRLRAAEGVLAARDKRAVPRLIAALGDIPIRYVAEVEEHLQRLAGEQAPAISVGDGSPAARDRAVKGWDQWWHSNATAVDLARAGEQDAFLGLYTICEYDNAMGMPSGQVWETTRDGQPRWKATGMLGAMDAQLLPGGTFLVAENSANRVSERTRDGSLKWEFRVPGNPIACQRLPNGNTFIATYNQVLEVDPQGKTLYSHNRGPAFYLFSAQKTKNGRIVCMTAQGAVIEIDPQTGKDTRTINLGPNGGWCGVEALPAGRYLVATMNNNLVREIDNEGKTLWQATFAGAFRASRLPNGNTLVASMTTKKVAELDRNGQVRWEKTCEGRPWSVHWR